MTTTYLTAVPAYGRDYTSQAAVQADWDAGKDFYVVSVNSRGGYVNRDDLPAGVVLNIRYNKQTRVYSPKLGRPRPSQPAQDPDADKV